MDMVTIVARFSPYETVSAVKDFVVDNLDATSGIAGHDVLLFKYSASLDKSRDTLTAAAAGAVLVTGEVPVALSECDGDETLGLVGLAPAGTVVVVWPTTSIPQGIKQGGYLKEHLREQLPSLPAGQVRTGSDSAANSSAASTPPSNAGSCCTLS